MTENYEPIIFTHKYETVFNLRFHWLILFFLKPWVFFLKRTFSCKAKKNVQCSDRALGGQRGERNGCRAVLAVQIPICSRVKSLDQFFCLCTFSPVFFSFFIDKFDCICDMCFFLLLFALFLR